MIRASCLISGFALAGAIGCGHLLGLAEEEQTPPPSASTGDDAGSSDGASSTDTRPDGATFVGPNAKLVFLLPAGERDADEVRQFMSDAQCTDAIRTVKPGATAIAWVSLSGQQPPLVRLEGAGGPWTSPSGEIVFPDRSALATGPARGIDWTVDGVTVAGGTLVWTGIHADDTAGPSCNDWKTQMNATAIVGHVGATGPAWTEAEIVDCARTGRVICLEK